MENAAQHGITYLDNNASTLMSDAVMKAMMAWCNRGNPSSDHESAREARRMVSTFRRSIAADCGFELAGRDAYEIIFTSCASESNCQMVNGAVRSYAAKTGRMPHVVTSAAEHKSLLDCCARLAKERMCQLTILPVERHGPAFGAVNVDALAAAMRPNTCLVTIMSANGETGVLNNLRELSKVARRARVPFHTDAAQLFGKSAFFPAALGVDAFSAAFHKIGGPPGVGLLVMRRDVVEGYDMGAHISGQQNGGMRGGTENIPGIGASFAAFRAATEGRAEKLARQLQLRNTIRRAISARIPCFYVDDHAPRPPESIDGGITPPPPAARTETAEVGRALAQAEKNDTPVIFWIAPAEDNRVLPNTLLLSVRRRNFSGAMARAALEARGVVISAGNSLKPSPSVAALDLHPALHAGVLRVSLSADTTADDIRAFIVNFLEVVTSDECVGA